MNTLDGDDTNEFEKEKHTEEDLEGDLEENLEEETIDHGNSR